MASDRVNRISGLVLTGLASLALVAVLTGFGRPLPPDEGTAAHIFQLSIAALVPTTAAFLLSADWRARARLLRRLAVPAAVTAAAFAALYILERH